MSPESNRPPGQDTDPVSAANKVRSSANLAITAGAGLAMIFAFHSLNTSRSTSRLETACASILSVVNPSGSTFEKHGSSLSAGDQVVRMLYSVSMPDGQGKKVVILCAFDAHSMVGGRPQLAAVSLNGHQLGPARLSFLNRFWLRSDEATAGLPAVATSPTQSKGKPPSTLPNSQG